MKLWLIVILIVLSLITYFLVQRNVKNITTTPVWLCWLVMMFPAFIWTAWTYFAGENQPIPIVLVVIPFVACPILYGWLIQRGRPKEETAHENLDSELNSTTPEPPQKISPVRPINQVEETALRNCFPWNVYYLQHIDYRPQAILCRGKLKTIPEEAYEKIKLNIEQVFGDRFFLIFQESFRGQPFFALVPNPQASSSLPQSDRSSVTRPDLALGLLLITLLTTTIVGIEFKGISPEQFQNNPNLFWQGLPYSLTLITILGIHELGHYFAASYYRIRATLPYFIPFPFFLGTLGAFVQRKEPIPNRQALFDIAIAGPIAGFVVTIPTLWWGLSQSQVVPLSETNVFNFEALNPRFSFLFAILSKIALGNQLEPGMGIALHPVAIAGYIGLLIVALKLMPVGQLDGGHIVHAVFGQKTAVAIGQITRILAVLFALANNYFWIWAIILWLIPLLDQPALNDVTDLNNGRDFLGLLALGLLVIILLPLPITIAEWLNI
ncbi:peptidase M50 [Stanieria cyanosphaera PCC 7437]|uniref:Peptidase M50 n=1 Tax=Stanieria cyanosphaera (strain ATCC 29371 / PCC 7437) TaxID=111780 RepID=K9XW50_STAC7|nr:site-2 protease family protein [Stanieria cyanosphaera]AFZ36311.1 peptidase M50 [Stanieria cyanosphaera PCC 7437]